MTERVWIVMRGAYSDMRPIAVFTTEAAAEQFKTNFDGLGYSEDAWVWDNSFPLLIAQPVNPGPSWTVYAMIDWGASTVHMGEPLKSIDFEDGEFHLEHPSLDITVLPSSNSVQHIIGKGPDVDELRSAMEARIQEVAGSLTRS